MHMEIKSYADFLHNTLFVGLLKIDLTIDYTAYDVQSYV